MKRIVYALLLFSLAACSESADTPVPGDLPSDTTLVALHARLILLQQQRLAPYSGMPNETYVRRRDSLLQLFGKTEKEFLEDVKAIVNSPRESDAYMRAVRAEIEKLPVQ